MDNHHRVNENQEMISAINRELLRRGRKPSKGAPSPRPVGPGDSLSRVALDHYPAISGSSRSPSQLNRPLERFQPPAGAPTSQLRSPRSAR